MFPLLAITTYLLLPRTISAKGYHGWFLHSSCASLQTVIRPAYQLALNEAQAVIDLHNMGDPDFADLKKLLLPSQQNLIEDAIQRFQNFINIYSVELTSGPRGLFEESAVVACDGKRLVDKNEKINGQVTMVHYDPEIGVDWPRDDSSYNQCFGFGLAGVPAVTLQYTLASLSRPDVIQLCPWWLTINYASKFSTSNNVSPAWLLKIPAPISDALKGQTKTTMDLYSTLDRYLLKHFLLTYSTRTAVGYPGSAGMAVNTGVDGWLAAVAAAQKGNTEVENLSWLGIGAWMIKGGKYMPGEDGDLIEISDLMKRSGISDEEFAVGKNGSAFDDNW